MIRELQLLGNLRVVVGLGKIGFDAVFDCFRELRWTELKARPKFGHGTRYRINDRVTLLGCYHPSQQNTFTGRLSEKMLDSIFLKASRLLADRRIG